MINMQQELKNNLSVMVPTLSNEYKKRLVELLHCDSIECWSGDCIP